MNEKFKESNTYKFFRDLILDMAEGQEDREYDIDSTINIIMEDDQLWQDLENAILDDLVEIEEEEEEV